MRLFEDILLCSAENVPVIADEFDDSFNWHHRDQFLMSWLLSSISEQMLGHVSRCTHSFQIWKTFEDLFQSQSKARAMNLRFQLQIMKRGSLSIDAYFLQMRSVADGLISAGHNLSDDNLVLYILGGLGNEYDAVVVTLTSRGDISSLTEVQSILRIHEMSMAHSSTIQSLPPVQATSSPAANYAAKDSKSTNSGNGNFKGKTKFYKNKVYCQLCGKPNHVSAKCYKRFDTSFQGLENVPLNFSGSNLLQPLPRNLQLDKLIRHT